MRKIRVLVIDDSLLFREVLSRGLAADPAIEVIATAVDPFDARDKIIRHNPDVLTCDVEMPKMNGIEFLRRLLPQYPIPAIVITTIGNSVFEAMAVGAVDFVTKPDVRSPGSVERFIDDLIAKVKTAVHANVGHVRPTAGATPAIAGTVVKNRIIAIGASTGGTEAIFSLVKGFPPNMPGIVIVQHIPPVFSKLFAERLNNQTPFLVKEAITGDTIEPGKILIAAGDKHMRVKKAGGGYIVDCFAGDKVSGHCPSVDVLFESVAQAAGSSAIGVILTGMGYDGAKGLLSMRRAGAHTFGQNETTCVVYGMPKVAHNIGAVEKRGCTGEHSSDDLLIIESSDLNSERKPQVDSMEEQQVKRLHFDFLAGIVTSIGDGLIATDLEAKIVFMNEAAEQIIGCSPAESIGLPITEIFCVYSMATRERLADPIGEVLAAGHESRPHRRCGHFLFAKPPTLYIGNRYTNILCRSAIRCRHGLSGCHQI